MGFWFFVGIAAAVAVGIFVGLGAHKNPEKAKEILINILGFIVIIGIMIAYWLFGE